MLLDLVWISLLELGLTREIKADGNPGHSLTSLSCSILANELYVAAKESSLGHFKEVLTEEIAKLICPQRDRSICQEPADVPDSVGAQGLPCFAEPMDRVPPYFSQMAADEAPIPAAMKNNSPYLALVWQTESQVTMIKLVDDPSIQMEDFLR